MRAVIQRVGHARLSIGGEEYSSIGEGILVLLGVTHDDLPEDVEWLVKKVFNLRIFPDGDGVMNRSIAETGGEIMVVSQFTLHASTKKGNRPSYIRAASPPVAIPLYEEFIRHMRALTGKEVATGSFGAMMDIELVNSGPVTIIIDTKNKE